MPRHEGDEPLQKHTIFLFEGDFARLRDFYPNISSSIVIRRLVRKHVEEVDRALNRKEKLPTLDDVEIE